MLSPIRVPTASHTDQQLKMRAGAGKLGWVLPLLASPQEGRTRLTPGDPLGQGLPSPSHPPAPSCAWGGLLKVPGTLINAR